MGFQINLEDFYKMGWDSHWQGSSARAINDVVVQQNALAPAYQQNQIAAQQGQTQLAQQKLIQEENLAQRQVEQGTTADYRQQMLAQATAQKEATQQNALATQAIKQQQLEDAQVQKLYAAQVQAGTILKDDKAQKQIVEMARAKYKLGGNFLGFGKQQPTAEQMGQTTSDYLNNIRLGQSLTAQSSAGVASPAGLPDPSGYPEGTTITSPSTGLSFTNRAGQWIQVQ